MSSFSSLNIQDDTVTALSITKKRTKLSVTHAEILQKNDLKQFLDKQKELYISIEQENIVDEEIELPDVLKNKKTIEHTLINKLNKTLSNQRIIFNHKQISTNKNDNTIKYKVDGVYEKTYLELFNFISNPNQIKVATASRYALLGISQKCNHSKNYISIHTQANNIIFLAINDNQLIFSRTTKIMAQEMKGRQDEIIDELNKTTAYINQLFKNVKFSNILLSGSIAIDDMVCEHLHMISGLAITVIYPNTFIDGLENEEPQQYILALGSYYTDKDFLFLPDFVKAQKQYSIISQTILYLSFFTLLISIYFTYNSYDSYQNQLNRYEAIKNKLTHIVKSTYTYPQQKLEHDLLHLKLTKQYLKHHPVDTIILLKPLIKLQKPNKFNWYIQNNDVYLDVLFIKKFNSLGQLQQFKTTFDKEMAKINLKLPLNYTDRTDYATMEFNTILTIQKTQQIPNQIQKRRRR